MSLTPEQTIQKTARAIELAFEEVSKPISTTFFALRLRELIVKRTLLGKLLSSQSGGKLIKNPKLSQSYILQRKGKIRFFKNKNGSTYAIENVGNKELKSLRASKQARAQNRKNIERIGKVNLGINTTPSRSNLTATGQLLESIGSKGEVGKLIVQVEHEGRGANIHLEQPKKQPKNSELINILKQNGRIFFGLSKSELNILRRDIGKVIKTKAEQFRRKLTR